MKKFVHEHDLRNRPHDLLWLFKVYSIPSGMFACQVWDGPTYTQEGCVEFEEAPFLHQRIRPFRPAFRLLRFLKGYPQGSPFQDTLCHCEAQSINVSSRAT
eukprot:scaffold216009_cov22-Tisochrysis_lutea.AAC.1